MTKAQFDEPVVKAKRDRWGRPYVFTPSGERKPYTRVTTFAGSIEDTFGLAQWQMRMTAYGMALDETLQLEAAAVKDPSSDDGKATLQEVAARAMEAAKARDAARIGTALHSFTEEYDRTGEIPKRVPKPYRADVEAYARMLDKYRYTPLAIEQFRVNHKLEIAGTADRLYFRETEGDCVIGDAKSGTIEYGQAKMAIQLALYAYSLPYQVDPEDTEKGVTLADPYPVNKEVGIIVHLPRGEGVCEPHRIDLKAGVEGIKLCGMVRAWRKRKGLLVPLAS